MLHQVTHCDLFLKHSCYQGYSLNSLSCSKPDPNMHISAHVMLLLNPLHISFFFNCPCLTHSITNQEKERHISTVQLPHSHSNILTMQKKIIHTGKLLWNKEKIGWHDWVIHCIQQKYRNSNLKKQKQKQNTR